FIEQKPLGFSRRIPQPNAEKVIEAYVTGLEHIYQKNKVSGAAFSERTLTVLLCKYLSLVDPPYVDWRNPNGAVWTSIVYDYDGEILPADEARSQRNLFSLGNVAKVTYDDLVRTVAAFRVANESLRDREAECRECAYNPYCGVSPVVEAARDSRGS